MSKTFKYDGVTITVKKNTETKKVTGKKPKTKPRGRGRPARGPSPPKGFKPGARPERFSSKDAAKKKYPTYNGYRRIIKRSTGNTYLVYYQVR